jgi:hypothetical protein
MNRRILAAGFAAIAFFFVGCGEESDCDIQCPLDGPAVSKAIDVLVLSAVYYPEIALLPAGPVEDTGILPSGSDIDDFSLLDAEWNLVVPDPGFLQCYDAILVCTDTGPHDDQSLQAFDSIGGLLADYVDGGGGLVICQFSFSPGWAGIRGRLQSPGYSPLISGPVEFGRRDDRSIVMSSIEFPLHPVFYGIAVDELLLPGDINLGFPGLDDSAILLAMDDQGTNAIAINAGGSIIGLNMYLKAFAFPDDYQEAVKLAANSIRYVSGIDGD